MKGHDIAVRMKRLSILGLIIITLFLVSCAPVAIEERASTNQKIERTPEEKIVAEPTLFRLGEEIFAGEFKWKITKMTKKKEIGQDLAGNFFGAKADGEFIILDVEVENIGNSANILSDSFIKLIDDQGREFSSNPSAAFYLDHNSVLLFNTLNPGITKEGKVVFDVPVGLSVVDVKIYDSLATSSFYTVKLIS